LVLSGNRKVDKKRRVEEFKVQELKEERKVKGGTQTTQRT
jgi:hypothetical protein